MQNKETKKIALARKQQSPIIYILAVVCIIALLIGGFFILKNQINQVQYKQVTMGNSEFKLEVADTQSEREKGLSERESIPNDGGMLFDFNENGNWKMWMLQMRFPIDIAWVTKDGKIVGIKNAAQPGDYPDVYYAEQSSWYVIEVPAGTFNNLGLKEGDTIKL